jgi:hypothetical protein
MYTFSRYLLGIIIFVTLLLTLFFAGMIIKSVWKQ